MDRSFFVAIVMAIAIAIAIAPATVAEAAAHGRTEAPAVAGALTPEPGIFASGRLDGADVERIAVSGIGHVIDLTLDHETPEFDEAAAMHAAGVGYSNLPVSGADDLERDDVLAFDALLQEAERPLLVHCASGNRVGAMAALRAAWVEGKPMDEAIAIGKAAAVQDTDPAYRAEIRQWSGGHANVDGAFLVDEA